MEKKSKVVLSSVLAIAMSASLAVGGTFALFTSESEVNVAITSGKVEVVATAGGLNTYSVVPAANGTIVDENGGKYEYVQQAAGTFKNGGRATIASENQEVSLERLTPGDKVEFTLTLTNNSNVATQIRTGIYCVAGPVLYQQLNITVDDEALNTFESYTAWETWATAVKTVDVVVEFPVTSGNEFQNLSTKIGYKIEAVQGNAVVQPWVAPTSAFNNYNAQASGNVATSTTGTAGSFTTVTSEAKTVTDTTGSVSAVIPAGTTTTAQSAAGDSRTEVKLNVQKKDDVSGANFTVNEGSSAAYVDISLKEVTEIEGTVTERALTNSVNPFIISMNVGKGLYNVGLQHKTDSGVEVFTAVGSASEVDENREFYYDFGTGELTLATTSFSPFAITYDTVYNATDNSATLAQIIEAAGANSTVKVDAATAGSEALSIEKNLTLVVDGTLTNNITVAEGKTLTLAAGTGYTGTLVLEEGAKVVSAFGLHEDVAKNLACEVIDGTYTYTNPVATVTVGEVTTNYTSLAKAVAAAESGVETTITLLKDIEVEDEIHVNGKKNVILDLNGHNVTHNDYDVFLVYNAKFHVTGSGSIIENVTDGYAPILAYGSSENVANYTIVTIDKDVTLIGDYAGIFISRDVNGTYKNYGLVINMKGTIDLTTMEGGVQEYGIYVNGQNTVTSGNVMKINLDGATIKSGEEGIYAAGYAKWTISNSVITADTGIEMRAGSLTVKGADTRITGIATPTEVLPNGNGSTTVGAGIAVAQHTTKLPISVTVQEGSIKGYTAFYESNPENNDNQEAITLNITGGNFEAINGGTNAVYSENHTAFVGGGTFTQIAETYVKDGYVTVDNNNGTYTVKKFFGSGTMEDPYQIGNAKQFTFITSGTSSNPVYYKLVDNIDVSDILKTKDYVVKDSWGTSYIKINGNGKTISGVNTGYLFYRIQDSTLSNLTVDLNGEESAISFYAYYGMTYDNVNVTGNISVTGNCGAYTIYAFYPEFEFTNCVADIDISGTSYNAVFVGYVNSYESFTNKLTFDHCENKGSIVCNYAAMFIGNPNAYNIVCNAYDCVNSGIVQATNTDKVLNYYYAVTSNCYKTFTVNGVVYNDIADGKSSAPSCAEDVVVRTTGQAILGPQNTGMAIEENADKTFTITAATDGTIAGKTVDHYTVYVGVYASLKIGGSNRNYVTETISASDENKTTQIKNLKFVDTEWVAEHSEAVQGELAGNTVYTLGDETYYLLTNPDDDTLNGNEKAPQMIYVVAYDANGKTLASVTYYGDIA